MAPIAGQAGADEVPYGAVVYDGRRQVVGVHRVGRRSTYQRKPIDVAEVLGGTAILSRRAGRRHQVVTRGAAELFGAEDEIGAENPGPMSARLHTGESPRKHKSPP